MYMEGTSMARPENVSISARLIGSLEIELNARRAVHLHRL
jgi:hypothetical protein